MKIIILPDAETHLNAIYDFVRIKSVNAATALFNNILDEIDRLADFPLIAAVEPLLSECPETFRALIIRPSYKVVYYIEDNTVYVVAVWDCRQNPDKHRRDTFKL
jgi:plasmid stabilization system protein ParE